MAESVCPTCNGSGTAPEGHPCRDSEVHTYHYGYRCPDCGGEGTTSGKPKA